MAVVILAKFDVVLQRNINRASCEGSKDILVINTVFSFLALSSNWLTQFFWFVGVFFD